MRILKYIFLLILLLCVGFAVFMATQKGEYNLTKSTYIKHPKSLVYKYIVDYRYWENWFSWSNNETKFDYDAVSSGKGGSFEWDANGDKGKAITTFVSNQDSVIQKFETESATSNLSWTLKDSAGGTKVILKVSGKMDFIPKIKASLKGGVANTVGSVFDESLTKLEQTIDYEIKTYNIKVAGMVALPERFYLYQSARSKMQDVTGNISIMMSKLLHFFKKNKIPTSGHPFVSYTLYDESNQIAEYRVGIPVNQEIFTSPGSDIMSGKYNAFTALKTIVTGDYSHLNAGRKAALDHISKQKMNVNNAAPIIESYKIGPDREKHPSKWETEIYFPLIIESVTGPIAQPQTTAISAESDVDK